MRRTKKGDPPKQIRFRSHVIRVLHPPPTARPDLRKTSSRLVVYGPVTPGVQGTQQPLDPWVQALTTTGGETRLDRQDSTQLILTGAWDLSFPCTSGPIFARTMHETVVTSLDLAGGMSDGVAVGAALYWCCCGQPNLGTRQADQRYHSIF